MQMTYRATKFNTPSPGETIVRTREEAFQLIAGLDKQLAGSLNKQMRATYLAGRATLYEALGDERMLEAAKEAYSFSKTANTAALVAVALHHFGCVKEANLWYERAYKFPHEEGYEIDIGYEGALLSGGGAKEWLKAWKIVKKLKKRMCYAAMLPDWDGKPCKEVQIISEGGFGDLIHNCRYLQMVKDRGVEKVTVFLPPFFFDHGFVELAVQNEWWPETKPLTECKAGIPSAGFFDLPAIFETTPETVPDSPIWKCEPYTNAWRKLSTCHLGDKPKIGFCWAAKAFETPLVPKGIYRSLTDEQAKSIAHIEGIDWVSLQPGENDLGIEQPEMKWWVQTAAIISNLDLVVTVDTAVMHLAASLGIPCWVILSGATDWKFGVEGNSCRWYPTLRLFRNDGFGFESAVAKVITAINGLVKNGA